MSIKDKSNYLGKYILPLESQKNKKKKYRNKIFIYSGKKDEDFQHLHQVVNVYNHSAIDFEFNCKKIIDHFAANYGNQETGLFTLGQTIAFRMYPEQEVQYLPLFTFFLNYTMVIPLILYHVDMTDWVPFQPQAFTAEAWEQKMNEYIRKCRPYGNMRQLCEYLELSKYYLNLFVALAGDKLGLSISNNDFLELADRNPDIAKTFKCEFDIPKNATPKVLETIAKEKTNELLNFISEQKDMSMSNYTRNGLFNRGQFKEFAVHMGHKPNLSGNTIPFTYPTNNIMGTKDPRAFIVDACGGRKAEVIKLDVSKAGALERSLCMVTSGIRHVDINYECDSKHFRTKYIESIDALKKIEGRVATFDPDSDEYFIVDPTNTDLVGKTIYMKTPITCTHPHRDKGVVCIACYGMMMGHLNRDIHIGRIAAINSSDDIEQTLLSAKHALNTNTSEVEFTSSFDQFFVYGSCQISFNQDMLDASVEDDPEFKHLFLEFHPGVIGKKLDGEARHYDRIVPEIIIFDDRDESRIVITEINGTPIYMSPEFVTDFYLPATKFKDKDDTVHIPFSDLIDNGVQVCETIFEYQYKNNELAGPVNELKDILTNNSRISSFKTYDECLNYLIPLFVKGGIHLPDLQTEIIVSQLIATPDGKPVDWTEDDPEYRFYSVDKNIQNNSSVITSLLYSETSQQIAGAHGAYEKTGTSDYDMFMCDFHDKKSAVSSEEFSKYDLSDDD